MNPTLSRRVSFGLILGILFLPAALLATSRTCRLTPETSTFLVHTDTEGLLSAFTHKRLIEATQFEGKIVYNEDAIGASRVELLVETNALFPTKKDISENDRAEIVKNMRHSLATDRFPTMHFGSQHVSKTENGINVMGVLRMKGNARKVTLDVALEKQGSTLVSSGTFTVKQTDFGIEPYSALLGAISVADEVRFEFKSICEFKATLAMQ